MARLHSKEFPGEILWLLDEGFFGYVGTSDSRGLSHVTPVTFVYEGHNIFFVTSRAAKKIRNINENDRIAFLIDVRDPADLENNRAILIKGRASVIGLARALFESPRLFRVRSLFFEKYPRYMEAYQIEEKSLPKDWRLTPFLSRSIVKIDIERILYWRGGDPIPLAEAR